MYVIINGVSSDTIQGLQVLSLPPITKPKMRRQVDTIDGRAGDIITELGYEAYDRTITVLLHHNYDLDAITAFFNTSGEIIFSNEPDKKYYFRLLEEIDYERAVQFKTANITFHVQPYKYPVNETPLTVSTTAWEGTDYDQTPYIFRAVSDSSVEVGNRAVIEQITGGTVAWNQLCNASSVTITSGHKYYMKKGTAYSIGASTGSAITGLTSGSDMVIDLTQLFGTTIADYIYNLETATAGAGVAWCKAYNPKMFSNYHPYNAGELMSVKTSARETVGFNQWDEEYQFGYYDGQGVFHARTLQGEIASKNMIPVLPNATYYFHIGKSVNRYVCYYDTNKNIISQAGLGGSDRTFTTPSNCGFINFNAGGQYGTEYLSDICINLSKTTGSPKNGDYVPYEKHTYPLSNIELRGITKLVNNKLTYDGDIYKADGEVTRRYGIVTIDENSSIRQHATNDTRFYIARNDMVRLNKYIGHIMSNKLPAINNHTYADVPMVSGYVGSEYQGQNWIYFSNGESRTVADMKTWLASNPLTVVYELATPTTETTTPYTETQICSPYGTESFVDDRDVQIPVGHKTRYMQINDPAEIIVPNAGNVPSAPTIRMTGSGTVGVYLGNAQALQVNIPEDGITIDTEAQDATSNGQLANRSVTGDYDSVRLQPGDNDVSFSGDVSAVITNYTRWV